MDPEDNVDDISPSSSQVELQSCLLAVAAIVYDLFPNLIPIQGQTEENSFYYDFFVKTSYPGDLKPLIQEKIDTTLKQEHLFEVKSMMRENAMAYLEHKGFPLQAELLEFIGDNVVELAEVYKSFLLCQGEVVSSFKDLGVILISEINQFEAYYPHLGKVKVLRIFGNHLPDRKSLRKYVKKELLAKERDPLALCEKLNLIKLMPESGFRPCFLNEGVRLLDLFCSVWKRYCEKHDVERVQTPKFSLKKELLRRTISPLQELYPHFDQVEPIEFEQEEEVFGVEAYAYLHAKLFKEMRAKTPFRIAEFITKESTLYAKDLKGLFRPKSMFGDVEHIFCSLSDMKAEIISSLQFIQEIFRLLGFDYYFELHLPKEKKSDGAFEKKLEESFVAAIIEAGCAFRVQSERQVFAGPRLEVKAYDLRRRGWLLAVLGIDMELAVRYDLRVSKESLEFLTPIAQSLFYSLERIVALLVEKEFFKDVKSLRLFLEKFENGILNCRFKK